MALSTPESEPRLFSGGSGGLRTIVLIAAAIVIMFLDHRNEHLVQIRASLGQLLYPLQQAVNAPFSASRWAASNLATRGTLITENEELRQQLLEQAGRLQRMAALEAENARIRALLDSSRKVADALVVAEIVAVDMDRLRHRVVLNRGSENGAAAGEALIDAQGVVGQIIRDRGTSAEALLITDPDHAVPVEIVRNGLRSIAVGSGDLDRLVLPFMARNADVKLGDLLVSSGLGGKFPAGYPVGTIIDVRGDTGDAFLSVRAKPAASLDRVREVLLVKAQATTAAPEPATADKDGAPTKPASLAKPAATASQPAPTPATPAAATPAAATEPASTPTPVAPEPAATSAAPASEAATTPTPTPIEPPATTEQGSAE